MTTPVGGVFTPSFVPRLALTVDYFNIKVTNAITQPASGDILNGCYSASLNQTYTYHAFCQLIERSALNGSLNAGGRRGVILSSSNLGTIQTAGVEFGVTYKLNPEDFGITRNVGSLSYSLNGTYLNYYRFQANPISISRDCTAHYSTNCTNPRPSWKYNSRWTYSYGPIDLSQLWRHISHVTLEPFLPAAILPCTTPQTGGPNPSTVLEQYRRIPAYTYFDLAVRATIANNLEFPLTIDNLGDKSAPLVGSSVDGTAFNNGNAFPRNLRRARPYLCNGRPAEVLSGGRCVPGRAGIPAPSTDGSVGLRRGRRGDDMRRWLRSGPSRWSLLAALSPALLWVSPVAAQRDLPATPQTVIWGRYDYHAKPAITIRSGETVTVHTLLTNSPDGLERAGVPAADVEPALRAIYAGVPPSERGPGGHILTGPIAVEGAEPGDMLEVRIVRIDLAIPYAYNGFRYGAGFLTDDFPYARTKIVPLDTKRMIARFAPGVEVPLRPFFGSMGVAPPAAWGRYDSAPPSLIGGNMDDRALVAGTTLFLPVFAPGALFEVGDGHAAQGNGEVDITALETSLVGTFQLVLHKGEHLAYPRAETPDAYIAMGFDDDLSNATRKALRNAVDFLVAAKGLSRDDAYMLLSVAGDVEVTELVDRNKGVHVVIPKRLFVGH